MDAPQHAEQDADIRPRTLPYHKRFNRKFNWMAATVSGAVTGLALLVLPQGMPSSPMPVFAAGIMGRAPAPPATGDLMTNSLMHFGLAIVYAFLIASVVRRFRWWQGIIMGGVIGFVLYAVNLAVITLWMPEWPGGEAHVAAAHVIFGLLAAAIYKGIAARATG